MTFGRTAALKSKLPMKCPVLTAALGLALIFTASVLSETPPTVKKVAEVARSIDLLVKPEKGEVIVNGPGKGVAKARTKPLDAKKIAPIVADVVKIQQDVVLEALKTRKVSEIIFAKYISDKKNSSLKDLLDQKDQVFSAESLQAAGVALGPVKETLDQLYTELAFISLDELK